MKQFKCELCDKFFRYRSLYERHRRVHNEERSFKCEVCQKSFNRSDTLRTHMNIHTGQGFQCCNRFYHSKAALKYHQKSSHYQNVIKCKECGWIFQSEQRLEAHIQTHIVTEFPMLFDCITNEQSNKQIQVQSYQNLILFPYIGKNPSI